MARPTLPPWSGAALVGGAALTGLVWWGLAAQAAPDRAFPLWAGGLGHLVAAGMLAAMAMGRNTLDADHRPLHHPLLFVGGFWFFAGMAAFALLGALFGMPLAFLAAWPCLFVAGFVVLQGSPSSWWWLHSPLRLMEPVVSASDMADAVLHLLLTLHPTLLRSPGRLQPEDETPWVFELEIDVYGAPRSARLHGALPALSGVATSSSLGDTWEAMDALLARHRHRRCVARLAGFGLPYSQRVPLPPLPLVGDSAHAHLAFAAALRARVEAKGLV